MVVVKRRERKNEDTERGDFKRDKSKKKIKKEKPVEKGERIRL